MMQIPRVMITAPASGAGKTMITCGLLKALKKRDMQIAAFKCGPDYIDPMFHKKVLGIDSFNLDAFLCRKEGVKKILVKHGRHAELALMEGVMGYYDGLAGISTDASAYDIADMTDTPAILVVDCKGRSVSAAALIRGFLEYRKESHIRGVILNRLSPMMYGRMKELIEKETGITVYGFLPVMEDCALESRYLGLKLPQENQKLEEQLEKLCGQIEETIDLDGILALAASAPGIEAGTEKQDTVSPVSKKVRIGIAQDEAFCFIYRDNLELLEEMGAILVPFSPLYDRHLPEHLDGMILYGGYPELYAQNLSQNSSMRQEIKEAVCGGLPCIAECGGFMYLQENIVDEEGQSFPMAGVLSGKSYHTSSLKRFGYVTLTSGTVFGREIGDIPAHEFHYYDSEQCGDAFEAKKPLSVRKWSCMVSTDTMLAGYPHIFYYGNPKIIEAFLETCKGSDR